MRRVTLESAIAAAIFVTNLGVVWPYVNLDYSVQSWNTDYTYCSLARIYRDYPWTWNPLWFGGFPFAYAYPPVFHLLVLAVPAKSIGAAYHIVSGSAYALLPATVYVMLRAVTGSRVTALLAAFMLTICQAPIYAFSDWASIGAGFSHSPLSFAVLMAYSPGPNLLALALTPLAVAAAWKQRWRLASVIAATILLTNWPGLVGLLFALAAVVIGQVHGLGYRRAAAGAIGVVGAAYGLAAFWMNVGYVRTTAVQAWVLAHAYLQRRPEPWSVLTWIVLVGCGALLGAALWRRVPPLAAFALGWVTISGAPIVAFALSGAHVLPSPWRYGMDFNLSLVVAIAVTVHMVRSALRPRFAMAFMAVLLVAGIAVSASFISSAWALQPSRTNTQELLSYQVAQWLQENAKDSRVFVSGELSGSLNLWSDVGQIAGGTEQGSSNPLILAAQREVSLSCASPAAAAEVAQLWLRALHCRYVVVHDSRSREYLHWWVQPEKFATMPVAWTNNAGDTVYSTPLARNSDAVVVDLSALDRLPQMRSTDDVEFLRAYVTWAEGVAPASASWVAPDELRVETRLKPGQAVLVKTNYDAGWKSNIGPTRPDPIGFLLIEAPPGANEILIRHQATRDVWAGRALTVITIALLIGGIAQWKLAAVALTISGLAYTLLPPVPAPATVSEASVRRIQPPLIAGGGIVNDATGRPPPLIRGETATVYGFNLGESLTDVRVWLAGNPAPPIRRGHHYISFRVPPDAPEVAEIQFEVKGCRGNSFTIPVAGPVAGP